MASKESKYVVTLTAKITPAGADRIDYSIHMGIKNVDDDREMATTDQSWNDVPTDPVMNINVVDYISAGFQRYLKRFLPTGVVIDKDFETTEIECDYKTLVKVEKAAVKALQRTTRLGTMMSYNLPKKKQNRGNKDKGKTPPGKK